MGAAALTHLDTCSGVGGFALAAGWAGYTTIGFCEIDPWCRRVLAKHWPGVPQHDDLKTLTADQVREWIDMGAPRKDYDGAVQAYEAGASIQDIADDHGITRQAMWKILKRRGVEMRDHLRYGEDNHFYRGGWTSDPAAEKIAQRLIARGGITPTPCEVCGDDPRGADGRRLVHAHHDDYNYPDRVRFLCQRCHHEWHKHNRAIERKEGCPKVLSGELDLITAGYP